MIKLISQIGTENFFLIGNISDVTNKFDTVVLDFFQTKSWKKSSPSKLTGIKSTGLRNDPGT